MKEVRVTQLLLAETGTYDPQFTRPYECHVSGDILNTLGEVVEQNKGVTAAALAPFASEIVRPSANIQGQVNVVNGWNNRRMRFLMRVETEDRMAGMTTVELVVGYTDHVGVIYHSSAIDPKMHFYVNSVINIRTIRHNTPSGLIMRSQVAESSQLLYDPNWSTIYAGNANYRLRPTDVVAAIQRTHLDYNEDFLDARTVVTNAPEKSRRTNNVSSNYVANILTTYAQQRQNDVELGGAPVDIYTNTRGALTENSVARDAFLNAMSSVLGMGIPPTSFTYGHLMRLDPTVDQRAAIIQPGTTQMVGGIPETHTAGTAQHWGGSDRTTVIAATLAHSIPAVMMECAITGASFFVTNRTLDGSIVLNYQMVHSFNEGENVELSERLRIRLCNEVFRDISVDNQRDFAIQVFCDLVGESRFEISICGEPAVPYVVPTFCDSLFAPVLTNNDQGAVKLASNFETMFDELFNNSPANFPMATPMFHSNL